MNKDFFNKTNIRKLSTTFVFILFVILLIVLLTQPVFHGKYRADYTATSISKEGTVTLNFRRDICKQIVKSDGKYSVSFYFYYRHKDGDIVFKSSEGSFVLKRESVFKLSTNIEGSQVTYTCISAILVFALYLIILLISGGFVWYDLNNFIKLKKLNKQKDGE